MTPPTRENVPLHRVLGGIVLISTWLVVGAGVIGERLIKSACAMQGMMLVNVLF